MPDPRKKTGDDYRRLAARRGFVWIGPMPRDITSPSTWECPEGHRWQGRFHHIRKGVGCPRCSLRGRGKFGPEFYHRLAAKHNLEWIGPLPSDTHGITWWRCQFGHRWETTYNSVKRGYGCHACSSRGIFVNGKPISQPQLKLCRILGGELNFPVGKYAVDIALFKNGQRLAIEYDCWYWHGDKLEEDASRDEELIRAGWRVLRIKTNQLMPKRRRIEDAISRLLEGQSYAEIVMRDWGKGPIADLEPKRQGPESVVFQQLTLPL